MDRKNDSIPKINIETVQNSLSSALKRHIGEKTNTAFIEKSIESTLQSLPLQNYTTKNVSTLHALKSVWGKIVDFVKWKTPLKRFFYKPFYRQKDLVEVLDMLWEHSSCFEEFSREEFECFKERLEGVKVWEEKYPEDPYSIVQVDVEFVPVKPVGFISVDFEVGE